MKKSRAIAVALASATVTYAVPLLARPAPDPARPTVRGADGVTRRLSTIHDVIAAGRASGVTGWDLVDEVTSMVHDMMTHYSCWHLGLSPEEALRAGQGTSAQYNAALAKVLRALGFDVELVHAARVRLDNHPWYHVGHTWVQVTVEGRTLDVCASRRTNRAGAVSFVPVTPVRPVRRITMIDGKLALAPIVAGSIWRSWLTRRTVSRWVYRDFGEPV